MSIETIATIKAKRIANKRKTIKGDNETGTSSSELRGMLDYDFDVTRDILNRERQWRNRTTVLQSSGKVKLTYFLTSTTIVNV
jgi:parafibromin